MLSMSSWSRIEDAMIAQMSSNKPNDMKLRVVPDTSIIFRSTAVSWNVLSK